ncbi:serine/threonine protein phosphatase PrpC [Frigoribacterium sp. PvP120]|uniref:PP2C family protein-serine/threonine phosphatase n=1 Tax=unclassified Frigoribacterium TaxID=2627005 RepID=UPI001AE92B3B|nr:protein phosphatase 2C domain-containing protein [Frigoribacterium sp. PvP121]MBP1241554.1 protein phosphatase [Frigoribacterium sp. PvP121]
MTELGSPVTDHHLALEGSTLTLDWAGVTDVGRRRAHNEDSYVAEAPLFVVADGMGGHSAGDVASDAVVRRLHDAAVAPFLTTDAVEEALLRATEEIAVAAADTELGVGTTVTGAFLSLDDDEPSFTVFNVGDSRVYLLDAGVLRQVTVDHSVVQEMVDAGMLHPDDAESHPDSNVITRAVGFDVEPRPDYWRVPLRPGQRLLVCSDGLTKELDARAIATTLGAADGASGAAADLVEQAVAAGGRDNVTAVVVVVRGSSPAGGTEADETTVPR